MATRIISAAVGVVIAVIILIFHNTIALNAAVGIISAVMIFEVLKAGKCLEFHIIAIPSMFYGFLYQFFVTTKYNFIITYVYIICIFTCFIVRHKTIKYDKLFLTLSSSILLTCSMSTLIIMHDSDSINGLMYLIMGLCGAWLADTGAYFVGTFIGKNKLCPEVSPKKTIEGFIGGILVTGFLFMLINFGYSKILEKTTVYTVNVNYFKVCILGMLLAVIGTVGDLSASVLKRQCGIKDYGNIMPGHGGLMDRFDSVVFVAPFLYAFVSIFSIYQ